MDPVSLRIPHPAYDEEKLESVKTKMRKVGPPIIRVVSYPDYYMAIEGCHRLTAAAELGFAPVLVVLATNDPVQVASLDSDFFGDAQFVGAGEAASGFYSAEFNQRGW
jgi:ParB-like chromosome segregation protein Spo0J